MALVRAGSALCLQKIAARYDPKAVLATSPRVCERSAQLALGSIMSIILYGSFSYTLRPPFGHGPRGEPMFSGFRTALIPAYGTRPRADHPTADHWPLSSG